MTLNDSHTSDNNSSRPLTDCDALALLIPAYAIGMTDAEETILVETFIADCPDAATELAESKALAEKLLYSVPLKRAPAELRSRLMAEIASTTPLSEQPNAPIHFTRWRTVLIGLAAAIALLIITNIYWGTQITSLRQRQQEMNVELDETNTLLTLIGAGEAWHISLTGSESSEAKATMLCHPEEEVGFLYAEDFPTSPNPQYTLWLTHGSQQISAGGFEVDAYGRGTLFFRAPYDMNNYDTASVRQNDSDDAPPIVAAELEY